MDLNEDFREQQAMDPVSQQAVFDMRKAYHIQPGSTLHKLEEMVLDDGKKNKPSSYETQKGTIKPNKHIKDVNMPVTFHSKIKSNN